MIKKSRINLFCMLIFAQSVCAQSNYDEYLNLSYSHFNSSKLLASDTPINQFETGLLGGYGFVLNEKEDALSFGGAYQFFQLKNDLEIHAPLNIHATALSLAYLKHWKKPNWGSTISAGIALISDYKTDANSAYQTSLNGMLHYGKSSNLVWTFGLMYSAQPFGAWVFPILGVDWKINDRLFFETTLFSKIYLEYELKTDKIYAGIDIVSSGQSFVLSNYQGESNSYITSYSNTFPYYPFDNTLFIDFYLNNGFVIYGKAGVRISQEYVHYTDYHLPVAGTLYNSAIAPSFTATIGLAYRIRKD